MKPCSYEMKTLVNCYIIGVGKYFMTMTQNPETEKGLIKSMSKIKEKTLYVGKPLKRSKKETNDKLDKINATYITKGKCP